MIVNPDVDGYIKALNHRGKKLRKTQKKKLTEKQKNNKIAMQAKCGPCFYI